MFKLLPENVHLATLGTMPAAYREQIEALIERLSLKKRVHLLGPVPYPRLTRTSSGAWMSWPAPVTR